MGDEEKLNSSKCRCWIKCGLALKFLGDGLRDFVTDFIRREHERILNNLGLTADNSCTVCDVTKLKPRHTKITDTSGRSICPQRQICCNCLRGYKTTSCPNGICDAIYDEILKTHESNQPYWKNTNISKWTEDPLEIAKCFINAPGYDIVKEITDIDVAGLLYVLRNNTQFHSYDLAVVKLLDKIKKWRNEVFHSPNMETEDNTLKDGIKNVFAIVRTSELKKNASMNGALLKLKKLETDEYKITFEEEEHVFKEAIASTNKKLEEIKRKQEEIETSIANEHTEVEQLRDTVAQNVSEMTQDTSRLHEVENRLEIKIGGLTKELEGLKKEVEELKEVRKRQTALVKRTTGRKNLRNTLRKRYEADYVKTPVCPLSRHNKVDIREVYVEPYMKKVTINECGENSEQQTQIRTYRDIFWSSNNPAKRVYIIGDAGCGKSAFCKMMISNWCRSEEQTSGDDDVTFMKNFAFLFYLPFQSFSTKDGSCLHDIPAMVCKYYKNYVANKDTLNDILKDIPEQCLIVCDGLDEWKPKDKQFHRQHETLGLPTRDSLELSTIITTSRPSALGILNMKESDCDSKVILSGIEEKSVKIMVKGYVDRMQGSACKAEEIMQKLEEASIKNIEKTPLLLQQVICLLCKGNEIGSSRSEVYSSLVNVALKWDEQKDPGHKSRNRPRKATTDKRFEGHQLPEYLQQKFPAFSSSRSIIFGFGEVAFECFTHEFQMMFGKRQLQERGIDQDLLRHIIHAGLLREENSPDQIVEDTHFTFTHTSFLEYFAALHVACQTTSLKTYQEISEVFQKLFVNCQSLKDILRLENMLIMTCGLAPSVTTAICRYVYEFIESNRYFTATRSQYYQNLVQNVPPENVEEYVSLTKGYMKLVKRCISEGHLNISEGHLNISEGHLNISEGHLNISEGHLNNQSCDAKVALSDAIVDFNYDRFRNLLMKYIDPASLRHIVIKDILQHVHVHPVEAVGEHAKSDFEKLLRFENLETLSVVWFNLSHRELSALAGYLTKTTSLTFIHLSDASSSDHHRKSPSSQEINLSQHKQLDTLMISSNIIRIHSINVSNLKNCYSSGVKLTFQLSDDPKLKDLKLSSVAMKHGECANLVECINRAVTVQNLKIWELSCVDHDFSETHLLDLSSHRQLRSLDITETDCLQFEDLSTTSLELCIADKTDLLHRLPNASILQELDLRWIKYSHAEQEIVLTFSNLRKLKFRWTDIENNVFVVNKGMNFLKYVKLENVTMSLESWKTFTDSLTELKQSVIVKRIWPPQGVSYPAVKRRRKLDRQNWIMDKTEADAREYIRSSASKFHVIESEDFMPSDLIGFTFKTVEHN